MKVTISFDSEKRNISLVPEDVLEEAVLNEMHERCAKGQTVSLSKIELPEGMREFTFRIGTRTGLPLNALSADNRNFLGFSGLSGIPGLAHEQGQKI